MKILYLFQLLGPQRAAIYKFNKSAFKALPQCKHMKSGQIVALLSTVSYLCSMFFVEFSLIVSGFCHLCNRRETISIATQVNQWITSTNLHIRTSKVVTQRYHLQSYQTFEESIVRKRNFEYQVYLSFDLFVFSYFAVDLLRSDSMRWTLLQNPTLVDPKVIFMYEVSTQ